MGHVLMFFVDVQIKLDEYGCGRVKGGEFLLRQLLSMIYPKFYRIKIGSGRELCSEDDHEYFSKFRYLVTEIVVTAAKWE